MTDEIDQIEDFETLALGFGGPGPHGKAWQIIRVQPSGRVFQIDYIVTDGKPDPRLTELHEHDTTTHPSTTEDSDFRERLRERHETERELYERLKGED